MTGSIGVGFLNGILEAREILKAREVIEEFTDIPAPETPQESISETPVVTVT